MALGWRYYFEKCFKTKHITLQIANKNGMFNIFKEKKKLKADIFIMNDLDLAKYLTELDNRDPIRIVLHWIIMLSPSEYEEMFMNWMVPMGE